MIKNALTLLALSVALVATAAPVAERVRTNDPSTYRHLTSVHAGAGEMDFTGVIGSNDLTTDFLYLHAGVIAPKGGIGHHFHHKIEEMYVILDGEAEFTINGHTSVIKGPALVPCKMGDAHAIYNHTDQPLKWLNWAVHSPETTRGDAFDLGDDRVGAPKTAIPEFVSGRLDAEQLRADRHDWAGHGALYRRIFQPTVFSTNWNHVDHVVIPAGGSAPERQLTGIEEVYYVIGGEGTITVDGQSATVKTDDTVTGLVGEKVTWANAGSAPLELLVIGVATDKYGTASPATPQHEAKAMVLQMDFVVAPQRFEEFEDMYYSIYVPAMRVQEGYLSSKLLRLFPTEISTAIEAEQTAYNYQIQISFKTEAQRRAWVASDQHQIAWPAATAIATEYKWRGYDVMGDDDVRF